MNHSSGSLLHFLAFALIVLVQHHLVAQDAPVVAIVDGDSISLNEVHRHLDRAMKNSPKPTQRNQRNRATLNQGVEHCVKRMLVLHHLRSGKFKTSKNEVESQIEELKDALARTEQTLTVHLAKLQLTLEEFKRELEWLSSWRKYARRYVTDEHLRKESERRKKYFDGTQYRVGQILWKDPQSGTMELANQVKNALDTGDLTWADAVKQHSQSASAKNGGNLGWIEFSGPMPRGFTQAAFELDPGEHSKPFQSNFGIHLVKCFEIKQGKKSYNEIAADLRDSETNRLFELVSAKQRTKSTIELMPLPSEMGNDSKSD